MLELERPPRAPALAACVLRASEACFARDGEIWGGPFSASLAAGGSLNFIARDTREARVVARMAAGIVKATTGSISIGDYNPRMQPVQAKRLVAFALGHDPGVTRANFDRAVVLRAALWEIDAASALAHAHRIRAALGDDDDALALAVALPQALPLVVLELPRLSLLAPLRVMLPNAAIFATQLTATRPEAPR
ncbi:MAG TPA: hypothetical protein VGD50_02595 [Candidatus Baltobacteraceae bacterium]